MLLIKMVKIFFLLLTILNNYKKQDYIERNTGIDERYIITENIESNIEILENLYKKNLLDYLLNNKYSTEEKIQKMNEYSFLIENINVNDISSFKVKKGGLMNDWLFEEF